MNPLARMLLSLTAALLVYALYWRAISRRHRIPMTWWSRSAKELRLRLETAGFLRLFLGWTLAFVTYAFLIEDSGELFTWHWLQECLLKGDWIGVLLIAGMLTLCERYLASRRLTRLNSNEAEQETDPESAATNV